MRGCIALRRLLLALALSAGLLSGCSRDILDVNRRTLLFAIGIDFDDQAQQYLVTYVYSDLSSASTSSGGMGGGSSAETPLTLRSESGMTVEDAISRMEDNLPAQVFYGGTRLLLLGEGLLRHGASDAINAVAALHEMPWRAYVAVSQETAAAFFGTQGVLKQRPLYSIFQSRATQNVALRPGYLFSSVSHAADASFATLLPLFTYQQQRTTFLGQVAMIDGREATVVPAADAALVVPLVTSGPAVFRADLPGWSRNPVILGARAVKARVRTASDGSVLVRMDLHGFVYGRARLVTAGYTDAMLEKRLANALAQRLTSRLLALRISGIDPRALADQPAAAANPFVVRASVFITLDRNQQVS